MILEFKQCLNDLDTLTHLFSHSAKNITKIRPSSAKPGEFLLKRTIRTDGFLYHIFKPQNFRTVQNLYQDKASMNMTLKHLTYSFLLAGMNTSTFHYRHNKRPKRWPISFVTELSICSTYKPSLTCNGSLKNTLKTYFQVYWMNIYPNVVEQALVILAKSPKQQKFQKKL